MRALIVRTAVWRAYEVGDNAVLEAAFINGKASVSIASGAGNIFIRSWGFGLLNVFGADQDTWWTCEQ